MSIIFEYDSAEVAKPQDCVLALVEGSHILGHIWGRKYAGVPQEADFFSMQAN